MDPITILVQGGIASGKSSVARLIAAEGAQLIDCDVLAHEVLDEPESSAGIRAAFGDGVFDADGRVARKALGNVVFEDEEALARLEAIVHPRVVARVGEQLRAARTPEGSPRKVVVIDAAVAGKMRVAPHYDHIVFVDASQETRRRRAVENRGWAPGELERREARQGSLSSKRSKSSYVLPNDGDLGEAESHVKRFWSQFVEPQRQEGQGEEH